MDKSSCLLLLFVSGCMCMNLRYDDCNNNKALLHVDGVQMTPYPPNIPGDLTPRGHLTLGRNLTGHIRLDVNIHKKALFWLPVPCISNFGSCSYDFCDMLHTAFVHDGQTQCPPPMAKQGLPCTCPVAAGSYTLNPEAWTIPEPPALLSWLTAGDYKIDAKLVNTDTGEQIGCYHVEITMAHPCHGFGCIFG